MSTPAHRVPFDAPSSVPYGRKRILPPLHKTPGLSAFIKENSTLPAMRECSVLFGTPCRKYLCPWCAYKRSNALRSEWSLHLNSSEHALYGRLSVESSHDIATAWAMLKRTRDRFGKRSWLSSISRTWFRSSELTYFRGLWHWHDNLVIVGTPEQLELIAAKIAERWARAAAAVGVNASPEAQYVKRARDLQDVSDYIYKGLLGPASDPERGRTPGDILRGYFHGDADDGDLWHELEKFFASRAKAPTLTQRGAGFRGL